MKKILSVLGIILMIISGLLIASALLTLPALLQEAESQWMITLLCYLLYLALFCFLFYLGCRLSARSSAQTPPSVSRA